MLVEKMAIHMQTLGLLIDLPSAPYAVASTGRVTADLGFKRRRIAKCLRNAVWVQLKVLCRRSNFQTVPFSDHQHFPHFKGGANYLGFTADHQIPEHNTRKLAQALLDQLLRSFAAAHTEDDSEPVQAR
jgi:hypothetical protein